MEEIDAAEVMLSDFCHLIPELYGERYCTHNVHLLTHLCKFVRLWGPLWNHSLIGFESKNGHMKHLFHGNDDVHHQILHNIDASLTMQMVSHHLPDEPATCTSRRNMSNIGEHCYIIGSLAKTTLTNEQKDVFFQLYKEGITYYCTDYAKKQKLKREDTICRFIGRDGNIYYGQIILFVIDPRPVAFVKMCHIESISMMQSAGDPCKLNLCLHVDLLSNIIKPVKFDRSTLIAVRIEDITGKPVIVEIDAATYLIDQPNVTERH